MKTLFATAFLTALLFSATAAFAQGENSELQRAIKLYREGSYEQAIKVLEGLSKIKNVQDEVTILNYLGLAYLEKNELKKARKSLERAVEIAPQNAALRANLAFAYLRSNKPSDARREADEAVRLDPKLFMAYFIRGTSNLWQGKLDEALADADRTIAANADFSPAYNLKADTLTAEFGRRVSTGSTAKDEAELLGKAVEALEICVKNCQKNADLQFVNEKLESLRAFYNYFNREKVNLVSADLPQTIAPGEETTPLKIISKTRASYTDQARNAWVSGKIVLAVLFAANGKISQVIVIKPLGYGLDQEAVRAARGIKFTPQMKNGKPVSVVKIVEYSFSIGR